MPKRLEEARWIWKDGELVEWRDATVHILSLAVQFGASGDRLWFTAREWEAPMDSADEMLASLLEEHARILARRTPRPTSDFVARVQETIAASPAECGSAAQVARRLHMSVRTLQRRLVEAGTSYRDVSELVSRRLAEEYLADPRVSIAELTYLLGFSEPSSFTRAFRRWTGETPGQWRRRR